jgi:steroid 5-alpha reductase family enzyme
MPNAPDLFIALALSLAIQAVFFVFAASFRTDKVTDLSYGLTFILLAVFLLFRHPPVTGPSLVVTLMVVAWGVRLAGYLFFRIMRMKRDKRFDGIREHFWKFFQFWFFQGVVVWIIMLPVILWFGTAGPWNLWMTIGLVVWGTGLAVETVADAQKFRFKSQPGGGGRWIDSGLWRLSRHPNYFGEILCWWGVFAFTIPDLGTWVWAGAVGPVTLTLILLFFTGIPTLEKSAREKWGDDPEYRAYRERTRLLVPWPK